MAIGKQNRRRGRPCQAMGARFRRQADAARAVLFPLHADAGRLHSHGTFRIGRGGTFCVRCRASRLHSPHQRADEQRASDLRSSNHGRDRFGFARRATFFHDSARSVCGARSRSCQRWR